MQIKFHKFKELNDNSKIIEYIKAKFLEDDISKLEIYSKIFLSIIELDKNDDSLLIFYKQVNDYILEANFYI